MIVSAAVIVKNIDNLLKRRLFFLFFLKEDYQLKITDQMESDI